MADKVKTQWILEDELYINDNEYKGHYILDVSNSQFFKALNEYGTYMLKIEDLIDLNVKLFAIQEVYFYMYLKGYLKDKRYVSQCVYDVDNGAYYFKLNLTKLLNEVELEKELTYRFNKAGKDILSFVHLICNPEPNCCCKYCGTMCLCASRFSIENRGRAYGCSKCNSLSNSDKAIVAEEYESYGLINAIRVRDALAV